MSNHIANKIEAKDKSLSKILNDERFKIDVFQREYRWQRKQIEDLISDLSISFLGNYITGHTIDMYDTYDSYYMGPIVLCEDRGSLSIVDGQQRLTSFTLLLLYLNDLQKKLEVEENLQKDLAKYLFVNKGGKKTLILDIDTRETIVKHLFENPDTIFEEDSTDESVRNIIERFEDIKTLFPEDIKSKEVLPLFIEWLLYRVVLVEVKAFSMENAYTIFETMNDRGLNLSPTEMLKGYLLSKIGDEEKSFEINEFWKERISELRSNVGSDGDLEFFRSWLRAKYADTIRPSKQGATNEDFEIIGTQFHAWIRNNSPGKTGLATAFDHYFFLRSDFDFFSSIYKDVYFFRIKPTEGLENIYITNFYSIADSLAYPLYLSPITKLDDEDIITEKIRLIGKFIDVFANVRTISGKAITQSSIRTSMYELVKSIRDSEVLVLKEKLNTELQKSYDKDMPPFSPLHQMDNWGYYHYFFARVLFELQPDVEDFNDLIRSRKQSSLIIVRIFNIEEIDEVDDKVSSERLVNAVAAYCLIRRYEQDVVFQKKPINRVKYLLKQGYLPEMKGYEFDENEFVNFIMERDKRLQDLTSKIWSFS